MPAAQPLPACSPLLLRRLQSEPLFSRLLSRATRPYRVVTACQAVPLRAGAPTSPSAPPPPPVLSTCRVGAQQGWPEPKRGARGRGGARAPPIQRRLEEGDVLSLGDPSPRGEGGRGKG